VAATATLAIYGTLFFAWLSGAAFAQTVDGSPETRALVAIVAPVPGQKACFSRSYDAGHLRQNPKQQVTAMVFELLYVRIPSAEIQRYVFGMSAKLRARRDAVYASGQCETNVGAAYPAGNLCSVDCDGGGVSIEKIANSDAIYVHLDTPANGIIMGPPCGEGPETRRMRLYAGADDKLFRLDRAPAAACRSLEHAVKFGNDTAKASSQVLQGEQYVRKRSGHGKNKI